MICPELDADEKMITLVSIEGNRRGNPNMRAKKKNDRTVNDSFTVKFRYARSGQKRKASGLFAVECRLPAHAVFMLSMLFCPEDRRAHTTGGQ